mmetsp:Transcript_53268/g.149548  ORF Transcript_53268/g.149548 Transcript_53268/m.149548 type:complete len:530 (+) Transcript_53268:240-1829(+)
MRARGASHADPPIGRAPMRRRSGLHNSHGIRRGRVLAAVLWRRLRCAFERPEPNEVLSPVTAVVLRAAFGRAGGLRSRALGLRRRRRPEDPEKRLGAGGAMILGVRSAAASSRCLRRALHHGIGGGLACVRHAVGHGEHAVNDGGKDLPKRGDLATGNRRGRLHASVHAKHLGEGVCGARGVRALRHSAPTSAHVRRPLRARCQHGGEQQVHVHLHGRAVHIVGVAAERVGERGGDRGEQNEDEDLDEGEERGPDPMCGPLRSDDRRDEPMNQQQAVACPHVQEGEWRQCKLECIVVVDQAACQLLVGARQHRRRHRQHAPLDAVQDVVQDPTIHELDPGLALAKALQAMLVQVAGRDDVVLVKEAGAVCSFDTRPLELCQCRCVEQAPQSDEQVVEICDVQLRRMAVLCKGLQCHERVEPLRPHMVARGAAFPPPRIGLGGPEHHQKAQEKGDAAPNDRLCEEPAVLAEEGQSAVRPQPLQHGRDGRVGERDEEACLEDAPEALAHAGGPREFLHRRPEAQALALPHP